MADTSFTGATINAAGIADWGLAGNWSNGVPASGTSDAVITLSSSAYDLQVSGTESFAVGNVTFDSAPNELSILGELSPAGTLYLEAGLFDIAGSGVLNGGALAPEGARIDLSGTLDNVTVEGPLTLAAGSGPTIEGSFSLTGAGGIGPGSLALTAGGVALSVATTQALNNATITLGGGGEDEINAVYPTVGGLTFGPGLVVDEVGARSLAGINGELTLRNQGIIEAQASASSMTVEAQIIINDGTIAVTNTAAINLYGDVASDAGASGEAIITGNGVISITQGGIGATVTNSQTFDFADNTGTLALYFPQQFSGVIAGFSTGDVLQLPSAYDGVQSADTLTYVANALTLYGNEGGGVEKLGVFHLLGTNYTQNSFAVTEDPRFQTSLDITTTVPCYARGTRIRTISGDVAVESLRVGEHLVAHGGARVAVTWLGRSRIDCRRHKAPDEIRPVRILANAFGSGMPARDLWLSPDHAVFTDGILIPIKHLINGRSIAQIAVDRIEYWHIELAAHDVLLAEGLPAESYLDTGNRAAFEAGCVRPLHPDFSPRSWADACAELVQSGPRVVAAKQRLFARARGTSAPRVAKLTVTAGPQVLVPEIGARGRWHYAVPPGARFLELNAATWMPAAEVAMSLDRRMLGVRVFAIEIDGVGIDLETEGLGGFHPVEMTSEGKCRWTTGAARIALPVGVCIVTLHVGDDAIPQTARCVVSRAI